MVNDSLSRKPFIDSSIKIARSYGFHGLDFSWIYPNSTSDMTNMGILFNEWRTAIDTESKSSNQLGLILTAAVHYQPNLNTFAYPVDSIAKNLDWVHVIAYDYHTPSEKATGAYAALRDPPGDHNTEYGIRTWIEKGMVASKMVLALPYFGYEWTLTDPEKHDIGSLATGVAGENGGSMRYIDIKQFIKDNGAVTEYNATLAMNYCYSGTRWIGFDDVKAIAEKVKYAVNEKLLGYYAWHVGNDDTNWVLSQTAKSNGTLPGPDPPGKVNLVAILVPVFSVVLLLCFLMCFLRWKRLKHNEPRKSFKKLKNDDNTDVELPMLSFSDVEKATNNFSEENKLGEGGFGPVYKGKLDQREIAVKRLSKESGQGLVEFKNEATLIAKLQHICLVRLLGCCIDKEEKILIYEYMPNKSLDFYIFDSIKKVELDWEKRVYIIEGIAQGLLYLHNFSRVRIIHRDLKAGNILLDNEMKPKISDFGMARIFERNEIQARTNRVVGTFGYMPPEYVREGKFSNKSDVFSFGVLLLEIISGKKSSRLYDSLSLPGYASMLWNDGKGMEFMDPILNDESSPCKLMKCLHVALLCVQEKPDDRPTMSDVASMLGNGNANLPNPNRPDVSIIIQSENEETSLVGGASSVNDVTISELVVR